MTLLEIPHRLTRRAAFAALVLGLLGSLAVPAVGQEEVPPLPEDKIVVEIDAPDQDVYRIGIPDLLGDAKLHSANGGSVLQNDFRLMPGFRVIGPSSVSHDSAGLGLGVDVGAWAILGANGVIKGQVFGTDAGLSVELRFYQSSGGELPVLRQNISKRQLYSMPKNHTNKTTKPFHIK